MAEDGLQRCCCCQVELEDTVGRRRRQTRASSAATVETNRTKHLSAVEIMGRKRKTASFLVTGRTAAAFTAGATARCGKGGNSVFLLRQTAWTYHSLKSAATAIEVDYWKINNDEAEKMVSLERWSVHRHHHLLVNAELRYSVLYESPFSGFLLSAGAFIDRRTVVQSVMCYCKLRTGLCAVPGTVSLIVAWYSSSTVLYRVLVPYCTLCRSTVQYCTVHFHIGEIVYREVKVL